MKDFAKNTFVVLVCVCLVIGALFYTNNGSLPTLMGLSEKTTAIDSYPDAPMIDEQVMPSVTEEPPQSQSIRTKAPQPEVQGSLYELPRPTRDTIGNSGLLPATPIAVIKKKTSTTVEFDACTVAFSLPDKSGTGSWAITAGHCGNPGQDIYSSPYGDDFSTSHYLGKIVYSSKMNEKTGATDWAAIKLDTSAKRPRHTTNITLALDTYPRKEGKTICKRGQTTGFDCGPKGGDNVRTQLRVSHQSQEQTIAVMSKANLCALPGDSGSPVFDKQGIIGVLSSTSASQEDILNHRCSDDNIAYYSPITSVIAEIEQSVPDIDIDS